MRDRLSGCDAMMTDERDIIERCKGYTDKHWIISEAMQRELIDEVNRLRAELAVFKEEMPPIGQLKYIASYLRGSPVDAEDRLAEWLKRIASMGDGDE